MTVTDLLRKIQWTAQLHAMRGLHPLSLMGCSRFVRDAYLCGLVFATYANDECISDVERHLLVMIGLSLSIQEVDVESVIDQFLSCSDELKLEIFHAVLSAVNHDRVREIFLSEFSRTWKRQGKSNDELKGWIANISEVFLEGECKRSGVIDNLNADEKKYFTRMDNPVPRVCGHIIPSKKLICMIYNEDELYLEFSRFADGIGFGDEISESRLNEISKKLKLEVLDRCRGCELKVVDMWHRIAISFEFLCEDILCLGKYDNKGYKSKAATHYTKMLLCLCAHRGVHGSSDLNILGGFLKAFNWHDAEDWYEYASNRLGKYEDARPRKFWLREVESRIRHLLKVPQYEEGFTYTLDKCLSYDKKFLKIF